MVVAIAYYSRTLVICLLNRRRTLYPALRRYVQLHCAGRKPRKKNFYIQLAGSICLYTALHQSILVMGCRLPAILHSGAQHRCIYEIHLQLPVF